MLSDTELDQQITELHTRIALADNDAVLYEPSTVRPTVHIRGAMIDGVFKIGTAYIP
ncbi:hypothetical protein [Nocardia australiensis]|uniref:hypothetical protein n=1 Tax=Nocardia australiensis TaxID=2887191 RepID=UPI001D1579B5|nr:hypothetical protein [Nocardia australiensis]